MKIQAAVSEIVQGQLQAGREVAGKTQPLGQARAVQQQAAVQAEALRRAGQAQRAAEFPAVRPEFQLHPLQADALFLAAHGRRTGQRKGQQLLILGQLSAQIRVRGPARDSGLKIQRELESLQMGRPAQRAADQQLGRGRERSAQVALPFNQKIVQTDQGRPLPLQEGRAQMHAAADAGRRFRVQAALQAAQLQARAVRARQIGLALDDGHAAVIKQVGQTAAPAAKTRRQRLRIPQGQRQRAAQPGPQQRYIARLKGPAQQGQKIRAQGAVGHGEVQVLPFHRSVAHRDGGHGQKHHVHAFHGKNQAGARGKFIQIVTGESFGIALQKIESCRQQNRQRNQQRQKDAQEEP